MPQDTFADIWRRVRQYNEDVPLQLAQAWVRKGYRTVIRKKLWSWALAESQFIIPAESTAGTITTVFNSAAIVGVGTNFLATDVQRQIRIGNRIFTVATRTNATNITIDRNWPVTAVTGSAYSIRTAYLTTPSDFKGFLIAKDPTDGHVYNLSWSQRELDMADPRRDSTTTTVGTYLVARGWNPLATTRTPMYEVWPHMLSERDIQYLYWLIDPDITASAIVPYTISGDMLEDFALAELSMWPGSIERPNPMFNIRNERVYRGRFSETLQDLMVEDEEIQLTEIWNDADIGWLFDAAYLQTHSVRI